MRQCESLYVFGGNVYCWVFQVSMCIVGYFRWQYVLLGLLGAKVTCWVFYVAMCVVVCFRGKCVVLCLLGGNVCTVGTFR